MIFVIFDVIVQKCRKWSLDAKWIWILCSICYCCQSNDLWLLTSTEV